MRAFTYLALIHFGSIFIIKLYTVNCDFDAIEQTPAFFSANLFSALRGAKTKNQLISPFSVQSSLAVAFIGSENETGAEIHEYAELVGSHKRVAKTFGKAFANINEVQTKTRVYLLRHRCEHAGTEFKKNFEKYFGKVNAFDYSRGAAKVAKHISHFVEAKTDKRIKNFIKSENFNLNIKAVMINTLKFDAEWESPFEEVEEQNFYTSNGSSSDVEMMQQNNTFLHRDLMGYGLDAEALVLPFAETETIMLVLLPKEIDGLDSLLDILKQFDITKFPEVLKEKQMRVYFPQLKLNVVEPLKVALRNMGIEDAFKSKADFSRLLNDVQIRDMQHETVLEASPSEVRGFAATSIIYESKLQLKLRSSLDDNEFYQHESDNSRNYINVDHPFFYAIINGNDILFQGTIENL